MSHTYTPSLPLRRANELKVAFVTAERPGPMLENLWYGARLALTESGVSGFTDLVVPSVLELPVVIAELARSGIDTTIAIGAVIRDETPHFDHLCQTIMAGLVNVSIMYGAPVGFGVLTCDTVQQANARSRWPGRSENTGFHAATTAISTALLLDGIADKLRRPSASAHLEVATSVHPTAQPVV